MYIFLAHILTSLLSYGPGNNLYPMECGRNSVETVFDTNVHVDVSTSYPKVPETSSFARFVNEAIQKESRERHDLFVQEMRDPQQDIEVGEDDMRTLYYSLNLVQSSPAFMSFYGSEYTYTGGVHGLVHYITKTFWQKNDLIHELQLKDLFLPQYQSIVDPKN